MGNCMLALTISMITILVFSIPAICTDQPEQGDLDPQTNVALGKTVQYAPAADYNLTAKNNTDATDLTDGVLSDHPKQHLWFDSKCVGWSYAGRCNLVLDLGEIHPIDEVAIRFQGGSPQGGVTTPVWMELVISDDGKLYRLAGEYSTFREGDNEKFGVPLDEGSARVDRFRFEDLKTRARFVGMRIYSSGLSVSDEMYVFKGDHDPDGCSVESLPTTDFTVNGPEMHFHKPYLCFTTNIATPNPVGLTVPSDSAEEEVKLTFDLPRGTKLIAGSIGGTDISEVEGAEIEAGDFLRYEFPAMAKKSTKTWGGIFIGGDWSDGQKGNLRYRLTRKSGETGPMVLVPLRAVFIPPTPQPEKLVIGLGWYSLESVKNWPDGLNALKALGMNTVTSFVHWMREEEMLKFWDECARQGFKRLSIDSTFHRMADEDETHCQFEDGTHGSRRCPSYRGDYYHKEINRVAEQTARAKPDYLFSDVEIWSWRGSVDYEKCTRCQADFRESGLRSWDEWKLQKGYEMWVDAVEAVRAAVKKSGGPEVEFGVYDWRAGKNYQFTWPFDRLYPEYLQSSQVSTYTPLYPYHIMLVGNECREDRKHLPKSDVLPWISPGDSGTFSGERFRYALLECFTNGARGMNFWSNRLWDAELMAAYARVVRNIAPVEDLILSGKLLDGVEIEEPARVSGIVSGDQMLILVADYTHRVPTEVKVKIPVETMCIVTDLDSGQELAILTPGETLTVPLKTEKARLLHVHPR